MGRQIADSNGGGGDFAPTALLKAEGAMLKGVLLGRRNVKTKYGDKPVYSVTVLEASCKFTRGAEEVEPAENDKVDFFAPTRLDRQLVQVANGETVTITYAGKKKMNKGQDAHTFAVSVEG